jgi:hypothetical protein
MNKVTFPLRRRMKRPEVGRLQDALRLLLDRGVLVADDELARRELSEALKKERASQTYGAATGKLVRMAQQARGLSASGEVDERMARALDALLSPFDVPAEHSADKDAAFPSPRDMVPCRAVNVRGKPIAGRCIEALDQSQQASPNPLGQPATTDDSGVTVVRSDGRPAVTVDGWDNASAVGR